VRSSSARRRSGCCLEDKIGKVTITVSAKETNDMWGYAENSTSALADDLARYRVEMAPVYQCLRRLLVQLAGLAILVETTHQPGWPDHPTLGAARTMLDEAFNRSAAVAVPGELGRCHRDLRHCVTDLQWVVERLLNGGTKALQEMHGSDVASRLERAHRALRGAANERLGFAMVDVRQSCCCCTGSQLADTHAHMM
jgi:hypothetical protein